MKVKNILIIVGSTWEANLSYNFSLVLNKKYNVYFLTWNIATYNFLKEKTKNLFYLDIFEDYNKDDYYEKMLEFESKYLLKNTLTLENLKFSDRDYVNISNKSFLKKWLNLFNKLDKIIKDKNIDLSISQISSSFIIRCTKYLMDFLGKKHIYLDSYPLEKNKFILSDINEDWISSQINFNNSDINNIDKEKINKYIQKFVDKNKMIYKPIVPKLFSKQNFRSFFKLIKEIEFKWHSSIFNRVKFQLNLIIQSKKSLLFYKYSKIDKKEKYIFFPIHVSEDAQILVRNQHYFDQINLIEVISRSLPLDYKLYIKEHPSNIWWIGLNWLKKIWKLENVKIINPTKNSQEIIQNSKWVIVINGSAWVETLARKKPLIILWNAFYWEWRNVYKCKDISKLTDAIKWIDDYKFNEEDFYKLFDSILKWLYEWNCFDYYNIWKNTKNIGNSIDKYIQSLEK